MKILYLVLTLAALSFSRAAIRFQLDPSGVCTYPLDLIFVLDGSESVKAGNFTKITKSVAQLLSNFKIDSSHTRVGVIEFSKTLGTILNLGDHNVYQILKLKIEEIKMSGGYTLTHLAIEEMTRQFQTFSRGTPGVPQVGVVITDGKSLYPNFTKYASDAAHKEGITTFAIGVGGANVFQEELSIIATDSSKKMTVNDFNSLPPNLDNDICAVAHQSSVITTKAPVTVPLPTIDPNKGGQGLIDLGFRYFADMDCTRYNVGTPGSVFVNRQCPFGQFWDQTDLTCRQSILVNCVNDPCRNSQTALQPVLGHCAGYYMCVKLEKFGYRSLASCCPVGQAFTPLVGCQASTSCVDSCNKIDTPRLEVCNKTAIQGRADFYREQVHDSTIERQCAYGTQFDPSTCDCSLHAPTTVIPQADCPEELYLPMNTSARITDVSGRQTPLYMKDVDVGRADNMAYFNGISSFMNIWRFANVEIRGLRVTMRLLAPASDDSGSYQALLTNCDFDSDNSCFSSFALLLDRQNHIIVGFVRFTDNSNLQVAVAYDSTGAVVNTIDFAVTTDGYLSLTVNNVTSRKVLPKTRIERRQTGIVLGRGGKLFARFKGKISHVKIIQCF